MRGSMKAYRSVALDSQKTVASPYKVVQMLLAGALERLARARAAMEHNKPAEQGELLGSAMTIVAELRAALNHEEGGEIASNLDSLYEFIIGELLLANSENSIVKLEAVSSLLRGIKECWDAIPLEHQ